MRCNRICEVEAYSTRGKGEQSISVNLRPIKRNEKNDTSPKWKANPTNSYP